MSEKADAQLELEDAVKDLIDLREKFDEEDALSFGIGVIWVEDYDEIPNLLKEIRLGN